MMTDRQSISARLLPPRPYSPHLICFTFEVAMLTNKSHWVHNMRIRAAQRRHICPGCRSGDITRAMMPGFLDRILYWVLHIGPCRCVVYAHFALALRAW